MLGQARSRFLFASLRGVQYISGFSRVGFKWVSYLLWFVVCNYENS